MGTASSIDEVIEQLGVIIARSKDDSSRLGYFAALYRKVTVAVKQAIEGGEFDDGPRMERLDVLFANRYLEAYETHRAGGEPTAAWAYAFEVADQWWPIVLQHLLLSMNAHINLDLGIAAADTVPPDELASPRRLQQDQRDPRATRRRREGRPRADLVALARVQQVPGQRRRRDHQLQHGARARSGVGGRTADVATLWRRARSRHP